MFFIGRLLFVLLFAVCEVFCTFAPAKQHVVSSHGNQLDLRDWAFFVALWYRTFIENK